MAYDLDGQRTETFPGDSFQLARCRPVYETLPGWKQDVTGVRRLGDLPAAARRYVDRLSEGIYHSSDERFTYRDLHDAAGSLDLVAFANFSIFTK